MTGILKRKRLMRALHKLGMARWQDWMGLQLSFSRNRDDNAVVRLVKLFNICMAHGIKACWTKGNA